MHKIEGGGVQCARRTFWWGLHSFIYIQLKMRMSLDTIQCGLWHPTSRSPGSCWKHKPHPAPLNPAWGRPDLHTSQSRRISNQVWTMLEVIRDAQIPKREQASHQRPSNSYWITFLQRRVTQIMQIETWCTCSSLNLRQTMNYIWVYPRQYAYFKQY